MDTATVSTVSCKITVQGGGGGGGGRGCRIESIPAPNMCAGLGHVSAYVCCLPVHWQLLQVQDLVCISFLLMHLVDSSIRNAKTVPWSYRPWLVCVVP